MRVTHAATTATIGEAEWNADHVIDSIEELIGPKGDPGDPGQDGSNGQDGADGASAYDIAVEQGFVGTEAEWLASLKGEKGDTGDPGVDGQDGLQGEKGDKGDPGDVTGLEAFPVGSIFMAAVSTNPATLLGYGTWSAWGAGRVILSRATGNAGDTGGSDTHNHAAHSDHAALTHSGTAVAAHSFTQPTIGAEAAHTHTYTQTVNHVHVQTVNSATTGGLSGYTPDTSSNTPAVSGYSTQNPTGGVASGTTAAGASHAHTATGGAVDAHGVTQPNQHAAQSHSAHDSVSNVPAYIVTYVWQRTA